MIIMYQILDAELECYQRSQAQQRCHGNGDKGPRRSSGDGSHGTAGLRLWDGHALRQQGLGLLLAEVIGDRLVQRLCLCP